MPTLTKKAVDRAKPRKARYELTCGALKGFILRVLPSGKKAFYVRYRTEDGKDVRERIGLTTEVSFADAKAFAQARLLEVGAPAEPGRVAHQATATRRVSDLPTLREFAERFIHVSTPVKSRRISPTSDDRVDSLIA